MIFIDPMTITLLFEFKVIKDDKMLVFFSDSADMLYVQSYRKVGVEWIDNGRINPIEWHKSIEGKDRKELVDIVNGVSFKYIYRMVSGDNGMGYTIS